MRLRDPKAREGVDGHPDGYVDVAGDLVSVDDSGEFEHAAISEEWAESYAEREGVDVGVVLVEDGREDASDASESDEVCGTEMSDGSTCERPADECPYH